MKFICFVCSMSEKKKTLFHACVQLFQPYLFEDGLFPSSLIWVGL